MYICMFIYVFVYVHMNLNINVGHLPCIHNYNKFITDLAHASQSEL
jgi:hypothetical protein